MAATTHDDQDLLILDDSTIVPEGATDVNKNVLEENQSGNINENIINFDDIHSDENIESNENQTIQIDNGPVESIENDLGLDFSGISHISEDQGAEKVSDSEDNDLGAAPVESNEVFSVGVGTSSENPINDNFNLDDAITGFVSQLDTIKAKHTENISSKEQLIQGLDEKIKVLKEEISGLRGEIKALKEDNDKIDSKIGLLTGEKTTHFHKTRKKAA